MIVTLLTAIPTLVRLKSFLTKQTESLTRTQELIENTSRGIHDALLAGDVSNAKRLLEANPDLISKDSRLQQYDLLVGLFVRSADPNKDPVQLVRLFEAKKATFPELYLIPLNLARLSSYLGKYEMAVRAADDAIARATDALTGLQLERAIVSILNVQAIALQKRGNVERASQVYAEAMKRARNLPDSQIKANLLADYASMLDERNRLQEAIDLYHEVAAMQRGLGLDRSLAGTQLNLAISYRLKGQDDVAALLLREAWEYAEAIPDHSLMAKVQHQRAILALEAKELDDALALILEAKVFAQIARDAYSLQRIREEIAYVNAKLGNYAEAEAAYNELITEYIAEGNQLMLAIAMNNLADMLYEQKEYASALEWYDKSIQLKEAIGVDVRLPASLWGKARVLRALGDEEAEQETLRKAMLHCGDEQRTQTCAKVADRLRELAGR